ncbi:MAG: hypothetical protein JW751_05445 [Polyangiaceae bacterium]|nr:hypothetical protein [Polyangiaceae bacterium]
MQAAADRPVSDARVDELPEGAPRWLVLFGFALTSATLLGAQLILSRLFATTLGCYYAFALVSLALLGLGAGGLLVQLSPRWFAAPLLATQAAVALLLMSAACWMGGALYLSLYPSLKAAGFWVALGVFGGFFPFFLAGGLAMALVFAHGRAVFARLYALDLVAAALGALGALAALSWFHPMSAAIWLLAGLPLVSALAFAVAGGRRVLTVAVAVALAAEAFAAGRWLRDPSIADPPHVSRLHATRIFHAANPMSNVSVFEASFLTWGLSPRYAGPTLPMRDLLIDGVGGTEMVRFDGSVESLRGPDYAYLEHDLTALGQALVPAAGRHLVIGPGSGVDLLQSVRRGRSDVTAVEINPLVARVVNEEMGEFSGRPYELPGVHVRIENGRTFIERTREEWDLISLTWVDTGGQASAMASSENYLYTVESYETFLSRLRSGGCFAFLRALGLGGDLRIDGLRGVAVAVEALRRRGITEPARHLIAAGVASPFFGGRAMLYVLVKGSPFSDEEVARTRQFLASREFVPLALPGGVDPEHFPPFAERARLVQAIVTTRDPVVLYRDAALDVAPSTDDNPFYFVERAGPHRAHGEGLTLLRQNLAVLLTLVVPFLLLPMVPVVFRTRRLGLTGVTSLLYFALLGAGFMLVEVELFQVFALVLGSPTFALATVLSTLLLASGAGSLFSPWVARRSRLVLAATFGVLILLLGGFAAGKGPLLEALVTLPFGFRVAGTVLVLAPLAFVMGIPLATGMDFIAARRDLVLWGWALNGSFSVLASVVAVYSAIHVGFAWTFALGLLAYALAGGAAQVLRPGAEGSAAP